jgi:TolB-like protein
VQIYLEKKIIAVKDFEVIMGRNKEVAKYIQEDITTTLVNSGQFNVVERLKLESVLEELKLSQTGLIDPNSAKQVGKLLGADIILTGTLAATGETWNANLRVINTETGLIVRAINKTGSLHELKTEAYREISNVAETFDDSSSDYAGWIMGTQVKGRTGKGGYQKVYIDDKQGANRTNKSVAMEFKLGSERIKKRKKIQAQLRNRLKRDLSGYSGIKFYIKGTNDMTIRFHLTDMDKGSSLEENWVRNIPATKDWREVRIPFNSLSLQKGQAERLGTNQIMQLNYVEKIEWLVDERNVELGTKGTICLDEVTFY